MKHRILGLGGAALLAASLWGIGGPAQAADNAQVSISRGAGRHGGRVRER